MPLPTALFALLCLPAYDATPQAPHDAVVVEVTDADLTLLQHCEQIFAAQKKVRADTLALDKAIKLNDGGKPTFAQQQASVTLRDKERAIARMVKKAVTILERDGQAIAFKEVMQSLQIDMQVVAMHLDRTDTGAETLTLENDLIATLEDMIEALTKTRCRRSE